MTEAEFVKLYGCKRLRDRIRRACQKAWLGEDSKPGWTAWVWSFDQMREIRAREDTRWIGPKITFEDLETEMWANKVFNMDYKLDPSKGNEPPDGYYLKAVQRYLIDRWRVAVSRWEKAGSPPHDTSWDGMVGDDGARERADYGTGVYEGNAARAAKHSDHPARAYTDQGVTVSDDLLADQGRSFWTLEASARADVRPVGTEEEHEPVN